METIKKKKMSRFQAFNKYILTRNVKIILALFAILTAVFYSFTPVNLAVSMFFAFVVMGIVYGMFSKELGERFARLKKENPSLFSGKYGNIKENIYHSETNSD